MTEIWATEDAINISRIYSRNAERLKIFGLRREGNEHELKSPELSELCRCTTTFEELQTMTTQLADAPKKNLESKHEEDKNNDLYHIS
ncbi:hypothetical protein HHI36_019562 [Cryptolaemus montrouzieri]|uniref:Uncharacterized protein n=1 Tax=Cryptolaemus montrouzieri TaxID=559131 RepID=A0ABD2N867_9CUCU